MNEHDEMERSLRDFDAGPSESVRERVMKAYDLRSSRRSSPRLRSLLRAVAAVLVLVVTFAAGRWTAPSPQLSREAARGTSGSLEEALVYEPATSDLLRVDRDLAYRETTAEGKGGDGDRR